MSSTTGEIWLEFFEPLANKGHWDDGARERVWGSLAAIVERYGSLRAYKWAKETASQLSPIWNPPQ